MIRLFNKITKTIILILGFLLLAVITGVGATGLYFKGTVESFYSGARTLAQSSIQTVNDAITNVENTLNSADETVKVEEGIAKLNDAIDESSTKLTNAKNSMPAGFSPSEQARTSIDGILNELSSLKTQLNGFDTTVISTTIGQVTTAIDDVVNGSIFNSVKEAISLLPTDDSFNQYYNSVTIGLTAAGGAVLGIYIISIIFGFVLFKHECGVRIRRFHKNNDLINHINKIFKKHPELYDEFYSQN